MTRANGATGAEQEPEQEEMFEKGSLEGDGITLKTLVRANKPQHLTVSIKKAEVPSGAGLADPEKVRTLLVTCEPGKVESVPIREDGKVREWKHRQTYTPIFVEGAQRGEAGRIEASFGTLLKEDPKAAGKLLDRLQERARGELTPA